MCQYSTIVPFIIVPDDLLLSPEQVVRRPNKFILKFLAVLVAFDIIFVHNIRVFVAFSGKPAKISQKFAEIKTEDCRGETANLM